MASCFLLTTQQEKAVVTCTNCGLGELGQGLWFDCHQAFWIRVPYFQPIIKKRAIESHLVDNVTWDRHCCSSAK